MTAIENTPTTDTPGNTPATNAPTTDWATDLDHADPRYNADAHAIWDELRDGGCPVAHTDRYGGMWAPLTHELVHEVAYDTDHFTSRGVVVSNTRPIIPAPIGPAPPITSDPPFHQIARRMLLPAFSPKVIDPWHDDVTTLCNDLLDRIGDVEPGTTVVDAAVQYAQSIPVNVIARMLGFPPEDEELFRHFVHETLEKIDRPAEERIASLQPLDAYIDRQVLDHVDHPRDDLTSYLLNLELDGQRLTYEHVRGTIVLLLIAGIDTTWSAIGSSLLHLATHPDDLARLVDEPDVMLFALEEFLRAYAPVTMARLVRDDYEFHGCPMRADEWVLLPFPAANRDPAFFDRADEFVIDRAENRHAAFGLGIHRCIGSNLARLELKVAITEFVRRFPRFELAGDVTWSVGQIRGPRRLPVRVLATS
jgi:cytochrome P450